MEPMHSLRTPYDDFPPTDCPICHAPEEELMQCGTCGFDSICHQHGCTNPDCAVGLKPPPRSVADLQAEAEGELERLKSLGWTQDDHAAALRGLLGGGS